MALGDRSEHQVQRGLFEVEILLGKEVRSGDGRLREVLVQALQLLRLFENHIIRIQHTLDSEQYVVPNARDL